VRKREERRWNRERSVVVVVVADGIYTTLSWSMSRSTQPCIPLGSLRRVPALIGWGKGGSVTSAVHTV